MPGLPGSPVIDETPPPKNRLIGELLVISLARLMLNAGRRFPYPFLPAIARGLGVPLVQANLMITAGQSTGFLSPLIGPLADKYGYRRMMVLGLFFFVAGMLILLGVPYYWAAIIGFSLSALGKATYDPAMQGFIGDRVPYRRRALAIGLNEYSWAFSLLLGVSLLGFAMERWGWRSPFALMGGVAFLGIPALLLLVSPDRLQQNGGTANGFAQAWRLLRHNPAAIGVLIFSVLISAASENITIVYGAWFEGSFGLSLGALGVSTVVLGLAEVVGESLTALVVDKLGKVRSIVIGAGATALAYLILPIISRSLLTAIIGLALVFVTGEFTIVSSLPLVSELLPEARSSMMGSNIFALSLGRVIGSLEGGGLWLLGGLPTTSLVSAAMMALAAGVFYFALRGRAPGEIHIP
jgi:MFS transporter, DHA1 family, inner membrane transport protein